MKNAVIGLLSLTTIFFGYHYFKGNQHAEVSQVDSSSTGRFTKDDMPAMKKEGDHVVIEAKEALKPVEEFKAKMSPEALKQVEAFEKLGMKVKFKDNNDGTMAIVIENNEKTVKVDKIYKSEQWDKLENALLAQVNSKSQKTDLSDEEQKILDDWKKN